MTEEKRTQADPKSRETRFGLVMYGGVSLAVYINGVAQEFFNAVRGRGVYRFIKALDDTDIVVDIVSGTSAGGINGIMLAYALSHGREFSDAAGLWRNDGDIRKLLRAPNERPEGGWSLLDSEGFYQPQLEAAFRDMRKIQQNVGEDPSPFEELDLFVTGTDVDGNRFTQFDDAGHAIDVKDHRSVFHLKHRAGRKEPFNPEFRTPDGPAPNREVTYKALAKLARITSCFPAAFSPVSVPGVSEREESADGKLQQWGKLGKESCFLDGGLIDNKPFTHTLREIFFRGAVRSVDRKLFYVEPDPEHWEKLEAATQPNFFQAVVASLIGIPGYESISDDLKLLTSHNSKIERYRRVVSFLDEQHPVEAPAAQVRQLYRRSRLIALSEWVIRGVLKIQGRFELLDKEQRAKAAELVQKFDDAILLASAPDPGWGEDPAAGEPAPGPTADFLRACEGAGFSAATSPRAVQILRDLDVDFRLRRLFRVTYFIHRELGRMKSSVLVSPEDKPEEAAARRAGAADGDENFDREVKRALRYKQLWYAFNHQIELLDILRSAMEKVVEDGEFEWHKAAERDVWLGVEAALACLLDAGTDAATSLPETVPAETPHDCLKGRLPDFNKKLRERAACIAQVTVGKAEQGGVRYDTETRHVVAPQPFVSLLRRTDALEAELIERLTPEADDPVRRAYENFEALDAKLFPVELVAELNEKDIIKTYRISPFDARKGFSNKGLSDKVSGDALYHFGGFFKRSWRSNDILWGRLDALCQLVETLVEPGRLKEVMENPHLRARVRERFYESAEGGGRRLRQELNPSNLFQNAGRAVNGELEKWLEELLLKEYPDSDEGEAAKKLLLERTTEMCENLIEAAQFEILVEDLPKVIQDSLGEQVNWNQFRVGRRKFEELAEGNGGWVIDDKEPEVFRGPGGDIDPFFGTVAAAGQTLTWMERMLRGRADGDAAGEVPAAAGGVGAAGPKPTETRLGRFFRVDYKVGTEALTKDMPLIVLLEIVSVSLLVLRNCVLDVFGKDKADGVRSHPLYIAAVEVPLRAFNLIIRFLRRAPRWEKVILIGAAVASVLTLVFTTVLGREAILFSDDGGFSLTFFILLVVLPALLIYGVYSYLHRESGKKKGWWGSLLRWGAAMAQSLLVVTPLLVFGYFFYLLPLPPTPPPPAEADPGGILFGYHRDRFLLLAAAVLAVASPYLVSFLTRGRLKDKRVEATSLKLKTVLESYFSIDEMRNVARRLIASSPLEWKEVEEMLLDGANDAKREKVAQLRSKFGSYKYVRWGSLRGRMEELEMGRDMRALADRKEYLIPVEDDEWPLELALVRSFLAGREGGAQLAASLGNSFANRATVTWGEVRRFMLGADPGGEHLDALRENVGSLFTERLRKDPRLRAWPYAPEQLPAPTRGQRLATAARARVPKGLARRKLFKKIFGTPQTLSEWQLQHTADKIVTWAGKTDSLQKLIGHMRFVNPDALYGE